MSCIIKKMRAHKKPQSCFVRADDGHSVRVVSWLQETPQAALGTLFALQGRTEYCEKYHELALYFLEKGYNFVTCDWRGQGLSGRFLEDAHIGHVIHFKDYQYDLNAMMECAFAQGCNREKTHIIAHSMGGAIALRAQIEGLKPLSASYSAPMWGIIVIEPFKTLMPVIKFFYKLLGKEASPVPDRSKFPSPEAVEFDKNNLTTDPHRYEWLQKHLIDVPELGVGAPSIHWFLEAQQEMKFIYSHERPKTPSLTCVAALDRAVPNDAIFTYGRSLPHNKIVRFENSKHEIFIECEATTRQALETIAAHIKAYS